MRDLAQRARISLSKAYAISNGDDNVEFETFENIAIAFHMSPAELATAIGKGRPDDDPELAPIHARLRQVPKDQRSVVDRLIATFVPATHARTHPATDARHAKRDRSGPSKPHETPPESPLMYPYGGAYPTLAFAGG